MLWRAHSFRQLVHLLPRQSVLELACGKGYFTRALLCASRSENPLTALDFSPDAAHSSWLSEPVEYLTAHDLPGPLEGRLFDFVVGMDLLDDRNAAWLLQHVQRLLRPGGEVVFFESNPWNPVLRLRQFISRLAGGGDPRSLLNRPRLYELMSEVGFIRVFAIYTDFLYAPLTPRLVWLLRGLSVVLENMPVARIMAGSILIHAQKPPREAAYPTISLAQHPTLQGGVSVVVPCYNEEMNLRPLVDGLRALYDAYLHEIILVDDDSTDATGAVIRQLAAEDPRVKPVFRPPPAGVGRALAAGYAAATGRFVLSMDCDFQHLLPELRDLFDAAASGSDVVVGSRFSQRSVLLNYPFQKVVANRAFHLIAQLLLRWRFRDLTNNLKLMRREVVQALELTQPGFAINAETGLQPLLLGYRVEEVPISWINRTPEMGTSSFQLARAGGGYLRVLRDLWLWRRFGIGRYRTLRRRDS